MRLPPKSAHGSWGRRAGPDSSQLPYVCVRLAQDSALGSKSRAAPPKLASIPILPPPMSLLPVMPIFSVESGVQEYPTFAAKWH